MLFECPDCKISFGPSNRFCLRCDQYEMPIEYRIEYLSIVAEQAFDAEATLKDVEELLIAEGVPAGRAREIVDARSAKIRAEIRRAGWKRVVLALVIMVTSAIFLTFAFLEMRWIPVLFGLFLLLSFGGALLLSGVLCLLSGRRGDVPSLTEY